MLARPPEGAQGTVAGGSSAINARRPVAAASADAEAGPPDVVPVRTGCERAAKGRAHREGMRTTSTAGILSLTTIALGTLVLGVAGPAVRADDPSPPDPTPGPVADAGLAVVFGTTAVEAGWARIRYADDPGLAFILSDLYPLD